MTNSLSFLGLAKKCGRLAIGDDAVTAAVVSKKARLIITACDSGEHAVKRANSLSASSGIPILVLNENRDELGLSAGRTSVALAAITDMGMAAGFVQKYSEQTGKYGELSAVLTAKAERFARRKKITDDKKSKSGKRRKNI